MPGESYAGRAVFVAQVVVAFALIIAAIVLLGWAAGLPALTTFGQAWTPMVVSSALSTVAAGSAVVLIARGSMTPRARIVIRILGGLMAAHAVFVLVNFAALWMRGQLLVVTGPTLRMAFTTAIAFLLLGVALELATRAGRAARTAEILCAGALFIAFALLLAFLFGATPLSPLMGNVNMSPITGIVLALIGSGVLLAVPNGWFVELTTSRAAGSQIARRVLPLAVVIPVIVGAIRLEAERRGFLSREYGVAVMVLATMLFVGIAILWAASHANARDAQLRQELHRRRTAEDAQRRAYDRYRLLFDSSPLPKWMLDVDSFRILTVNDAAVNAYGYSVDEFLGLHMRDIIVADDPDSALRNLAESPTSAPVSLQHRRKDGGIMDVEVTAALLELDGQRVRLSVIQDVTARKKAEAELRELTASLERRVAQRTAELEVANRELESFAYSVSHDLRTPLRALDGFSQALLEDYGSRLDDSGRDYLSRIRRGSQRMGDLIDALLDLSRVTRAQVVRQPVDLSHTAAEIVESLRERTPSREVEVHVDDGISTVGDPRLLRALLENLLSNAWKFTTRQSGARVEFRREGSNGDERYVVRDNGVGFDMAYASKLFGAFQRLHDSREFEGTGVGLATAQRIVHRHGGTIWAESAPNRGAAFYFTLARDHT